MTVSGTPGTGTITLGSAVSMFQTFAAAGVLNGQLVSYIIEDGINWEIGQGTYGSSGTTLARTTISASSASGAAISATSSATVYLDALAADVQGVTVPSGRLSLASGVPYSATNTSGSTVYFTPYRGTHAPYWDGSNWVSGEFTELSQALSDATLSPAAAAVSSVYDIFLWKKNGIPVISRGPAWTTPASNRGSGAGTTDLQIVQGFWCNAHAITNGPAAGYGLYLGSIATWSDGVCYQIWGSAASGGSCAWLGVWNNFNRIMSCPIVTDNGASYTYTSGTCRQARGSTQNAIWFLQGLSEDGIEVTYTAWVNFVAVAGANIYCGWAVDSTTGMACDLLFQAYTTFAGGNDGVCSMRLPSYYGQHYISANEQGDGSHANTLCGRPHVLSMLIRT